MAILGSYCLGENIVPKEILPKIFSILINLITKVKILPPEEADSDIAKKKDLLFCLIKLSEMETDG